MEENLNQERTLDSNASEIVDFCARVVVQESEFSPSGVVSLVGCGYHSEDIPQAYDHDVTAFKHQHKRERAIGDADPVMISRAFSDGLKI